MKKILTTIIILVLITILVWLDYTWEQRILKTNNENWTVISREKDWTFIKPWTWFKKPTVAILLLEKGTYGKLNNDVYYAHTLTFRKGVSEFDNIEIVDSKNNKSTSLKSLEEFKLIDDEKLKKMFWIYYSNSSMLHSLAEFLKTNVKSYIIIDALGEEKDITNYISSGLYNVKERVDEERVLSLTNQKPYIITNDDLSLVSISLANWFKKHKEFTTIDNNLDHNQINYSHSQMFFTITDVFSIKKIAKYNERDTALNFQLTFSKLYYPNKKSENEAMLFFDE